MELTKPKFKKTEGGMIPEDWNIKDFGELMESIIGGGTPSRSNQSYWGMEIPWVTVKDFTTFNRFQTQEYITKEGLHNSASHLIPKGTIITSTRMALGKAVIYNVDVSINQDLKAIFPKKSVITTFLYYWFQFNSKVIESLGSGSTVMGLSLPDLKKIKVRVPPLQEQKAIATALSDVDELINNLEKLIAKKKAIKQGAMQQLLTPPHKGGKRLEGFSGEWVEKTVGEVLILLSDYTANGSFESLKINVRYYTSTNYAVLVRTTDLDKKNFEPQRFTDKTGYDFLKKTALYGGEIIIANVGSIGKVFRVPNYPMPMTLAPNTYLLKFSSETSEDYIYHWMKTKDFVEKLLSKVGSTTLLAINKDNLREIKFWIPFDLKEQIKIAELLSAIDAEIENLEKKFVKVNSIKQGMMQELLTGKTRLV
jgi:type I restriction enzyme S subunit